MSDRIESYVRDGVIHDHGYGYLIHTKKLVNAGYVFKDIGHLSVWLSLNFDSWSFDDGRKKIKCNCSDYRGQWMIQEMDKLLMFCMNRNHFINISCYSNNNSKYYYFLYDMQNDTIRVT